MKSTRDARTSIKAAYEELTGELFFVPLKYFSLIYAVRIDRMTPEDAAKLIQLDSTTSLSKEVCVVPEYGNNSLDFFKEKLHVL